jgi:hypothetical protein
MFLDRRAVLSQLLFAAPLGGALLASRAYTQGPARTAWLNPYRDAASRLIHASTKDDFAWRRLAELTDTYGHRLSGSENLERAIVWAAETMKRDGLENVRMEPVMVPRWVRGQESAEILSPPRHPLAILGLGGSIATPPEGIEADVVVVSGFDELRERSTDVRGRIVLFNAPFTTYTDTVAYRTGGRAGPCCRPDGPSHASHRQPAIRLERPPHSRRIGLGGGCRSNRAPRGAGPHGPRAPQDGGAHRG